jgi:hypothetical protein
VHRDVTQQVLGVPGLGDDVEAGLLEQPRNPLAEQNRVLGEHDADGRAAGTGAERWEAAAESGLVQLEDPLRVGQLRERPEPEVA